MPCRGGKDFFSAPGRRFCRLLTVRGSLRNIFLFSAEYFKQGFLLCRRASLQGLRHGKFRVLLRQPVFFLPVLPGKEGAYGKGADADDCQDHV
ncbi:hypothetical protein C5O14_03295 [Akkermansia muciniphila]|jgi:hypothetical protein|nr:hypothetical protein C1O59_03295 [Akkermansia muciniphila]QHV18432.1 hypothetical protein C5O11_03520 [Akkermansia muciniphila]QHV27485.1 hypothetical protein C5O14_03295 [Akkermansia muciniphila]